MSDDVLARRALFISYRRSDSQPWTGRLADDLRDYFGYDRIYRDLDNNLSAQDFRRQVDKALERSRVVIAVIGPQWVNARGESSSRRLDYADDLVRLELERTLASGIALVPVLVGGASMPPKEALPPSLRTLSRLQGHHLRDEDWRYDFGRLLEVIDGFGLRPGSETGTDGSFDIQRAIKSARRYERSFQASRRRTYDAMLGAVELLRYPRMDENPEGAQVQVQVRGRAVECKVIDAGPGQSTVVVEFNSLGTGVLVGGSAGVGLVLSSVLGPLPFMVGLGTTAALRAWEERFATGLLDNIESVLNGRGIIEDSSLLPGVANWRNRRRKV